MKAALRINLLIVTTSVFALSIGCATKKPKAAAESPETRKERSWDYQEVDKQIDKEKKEVTEQVADHKDCEAITSGKDAGFYKGGKVGKHTSPHHDQCRPVESNRGIGEGTFENDDLGPHRVGH